MVKPGWTQKLKDEILKVHDSGSWHLKQANVQRDDVVVNGSCTKCKQKIVVSMSRETYDIHVTINCDSAIEHSAEKKRRVAPVGGLDAFGTTNNVESTSDDSNSSSQDEGPNNGSNPSVIVEKADDDFNSSQQDDSLNSDSTQYELLKNACNSAIAAFAKIYRFTYKNNKSMKRSINSYHSNVLDDSEIFTAKGIGALFVKWVSLVGPRFCSTVCKLECSTCHSERKTFGCFLQLDQIDMKQKMRCKICAEEKYIDITYNKIVVLELMYTEGTKISEIKAGLSIDEKLFDLFAVVEKKNTQYVSHVKTANGRLSDDTKLGFAPMPPGLVGEPKDVELAFFKRKYSADQSDLQFHETFN